MMNLPKIRHYSGLERNIAQIFRFAGVPFGKESLPAMDSARGELDKCLAQLPETAGGALTFFRTGVLRHDDSLEIGGMNITSSALSEHLQGCPECLLVAATAGLEYDRLIQKNSRLSPAKALWFQAIGASAVETVLDAFCADMEREIGPLTSRFSPGYGDLSMDVQRDMFALLKPEKSIGLTLNDSLLMSPTKSVTAIIGIKEQSHEPTA